MAVSNGELQSKAQGFIKAIEKMTERERIEFPSVEYGQDYNRLREMILCEHEDLEEILPPAVTADEGKTLQRYGEIDTYCRQIYQLLRGRARP